jgi:hypothetical protein
MSITALDAEIDREIVETDLTESALPIEDVEEVETENTVTGETTLILRHLGAGRTLLTRGPVAEVTAMLESLRTSLMPQSPAK